MTSKQKHKIHIPPASAKYARRLFRDWANLTDSPDDARLMWFRKRHVETFDFLPENVTEDFRGLVRKVGSLLGFAWRESEEYKRDYYLFRARRRYDEMREKYASEEFQFWLEPIEARNGPGSGWDVWGLDNTPFHTSMTILHTRLVKKMRCCKADDRCTGFKYFFAKRRNQKVCGTDCSELALAESKRRYKAREKSSR
jgi:hypothetical protein